MKPIWRHEFVPVLAILLALSFVGYGSLLRRGHVPYSAHSDIVAMHLATKTVLSESLERGDGLPFWRNDQFSGAPAFTNPESQYTYPLHFLFYLLTPQQAMGPTIWMQFLVGALVIFRVGRVLGLGRQACLFMAIAQLFNFKLIAITYAGFLPILPIATLFPLLFASVFRLAQKPDLRRQVVLAASGALCLSTGGFQLLYYTAIFLAAFLIWRSVGWWRSGRSDHLRRVAAGVFTGAALSLGAMAYLLVPLLAESSLLSRASSSYEFFVSGYSLTADHLRNLVDPESFGRLFDASEIDVYLWEEVVYFGMIPLALAIVGALRGRRRPMVRFLVLAFGCSLLLATESPLTRLLYESLPGFGLFRMPIRFVYFTGFFGICLAGIGLDEATALLRERRLPKRLAIATRAIPAALMILVSVEGVFYAHRYIETEPASVVLPETDYAAFFAADETTYRIAPLFRHSVQPGWAAPMKLQSVTGYLPYNLQHYRSYLEFMRRGSIDGRSHRAWADLGDVVRWDLLDLLNVKYVVSRLPVEQLERSGFRQVARLESEPMFVFFEGMRQSDIYVYRNRRFVERAFWARNVVAAEDDSDLVRLMGEHDLRETALILAHADGRSSGSPIDESPRDRVEVVASTNGRLVLDTRAEQRRFLTISEIWHPGWRGTIDGEELPLERCDLALMGAWVPSGEHQIVLRFRPLYWLPSVLVSAVSITTLAVLFAAGLIGLRRKRRARGQRDPLCCM